MDPFLLPADQHRISDTNKGITISQSMRLELTRLNGSELIMYLAGYVLEATDFATKYTVVMVCFRYYGDSKNCISLGKVTMLADSKIKIRQIEAFRCFMLSGTVTGAAELLYISQPAVSRLLSELEYRVGFPLFVRTHNKLEATPEAKLFYKDVNRVFVGMNSLTTSADAIARNNQGRLRVGVMPICSNSFMTDVIAEFVSLHPNVTIELESASRIQLLEMVRSHQIDTAIMTNNEADEEEFNCRFLRKHRAVVMMKEDHPLAEKGSLSPLDLKNERFMTLGYGSPFRTRVEDAFIKQSVKRNIILEAREQSTLFQLVKKGVGIAILDPFVLNSGEEGVVSRPFEPVTEWEYHVVQAKGIQTPRMVDAFHAILFDYFDKQFI